MKKQKIEAKNLDYFYDEVEDLLYIHLKKNNCDSSKEINGIIFDLNKKNEIIGLEVLKATEFFGTTQEFLKNMTLANLEVVINTKGIMFKAFLKSSVNKKSKQKTSTENFKNLYNLHSQTIELELIPVGKIVV